MITAFGIHDGPFPINVKPILLAQYSLLHHSTRRRRVSRPIAPPSDSDSLPLDWFEGAGDATRDGIGEGNIEADNDAFLAMASARSPFAFKALPASVNVRLFPLPNLLHTWPGLLRCLLSWKMRHMSFCKFFLFSESTAFSSRDVQDGEKSGEWKNPEKRVKAPAKALVPTEKW